MKTVLLATVLLSAAPMAAHAQSQAQSQSAEELTRLLNGAPPAAARPVTPAPTPAPAQTTAAPVRSTVAPTSRPAPVQTAPARVTTAPRPTPTPAAPARAPVAATPIVPARPSPAPTPAPAPVRAAPSAPGALSAAAIAALPFRIDLPSGVQLFEGRAAPDAKVWSVRKGTKTLAMIYAGPSSQFPIYDGEQVTAAGRISVVVPEGTRRIAMEHWFQRAIAPTEIHVWLMSLSGADRDAAETIGQSVDPK